MNDSKWMDNKETEGFKGGVMWASTVRVIPGGRKIETIGSMCRVRDYMSPVPIMFVTDLARGGNRRGGGGTKSFPYKTPALGS
jgi:hypothetical protein